MKNINKIILITFILIAFTSCDDALDTLLFTSIELDETIVDVPSLNVAVNGTYSRFATADVYNRGLIVLPALLSDNCFMDPLDNRGRFLEYDNYTVNENDTRADALWDDLYRSVAQTTIILREAAKLDIPNSQMEDANQYIGEAHALRALSLLLLQQYFAQPYNYTSDNSHFGVPIPDFDLVGLEILNPSRSTTAEVYTQILSDLQMAISNMREENSPYRIDITAAKALLARVYLYMENWSDAELIATEVISEFGSELIEHDDYVASWEEDQSSESIFTLSNTDLDNSGNGSASFFFLDDFEAFATPDFTSIYSATDVRLNLYPFDSNHNQYLVAKYPSSGTGTDNIEVIRLSEIYLIKAEAHARMNQTADAQNILNEIVQIRDEIAPAVTEVGQALIDRIILERRKELAFEGFRLYDLTRTATTFTKFRVALDNLIINAPSNFTILPIPIDELNANHNIRSQQNPGY